MNLCVRTRGYYGRNEEPIRTTGFVNLMEISLAGNMTRKEHGIASSLEEKVWKRTASLILSSVMRQQK